MPLITSDLTRDEGFARLSPKAAVLFVLILTRLNPHGKMETDLYSLKGMCCRLIDYIQIKDLPGLLLEVSGSTSVKVWSAPGGTVHIHAIRFQDYNKGLRELRLGKDRLPSFDGQKLELSGSTPGVPFNKGIKKLEVRKKEKNNNWAPPTSEEVLDYVIAKGYHFDPESFIAYYEAQGWKTKGGRKVENWEALCVTWEKTWAKSNPSTLPEIPDENGAFWARGGSRG